MTVEKKQRRLSQMAELQRKNRELEAQLASTYHFASVGLADPKGPTRARTMASGVLVQMHYLGGREVCPAFVLKDGLSDELILALRRDIKHSWDRAVEFKVGEV